MAVLGPALPYLRATEDLSYLVGALHQVAFSIGGGVAGALSARGRLPGRRRAVIVVGLAGASLAGLALGYGDAAPVTIVAAGLVGLLATLSLIRLWASLADAHGERRAVAMTEGEVAVSLAGIVTPLLIGALAAGALTWRFTFVVGVAVTALAVAPFLRLPVPPPTQPAPAPAAAPRLQPTLVIIFAIVALEFALSFWLASYLDDDIGAERDTAVALVSLLYGANLVGRLLVSRLARRHSPEVLLVVALITVAAGLPLILAAQALAVALPGVVLCGVGIGALFPLTSSLHIGRSTGTADSALGQVLAAAAPGQIAGPLIAGVVAEASSLRAGLFVLPALVLLAAAGLAAHHRD